MSAAQASQQAQQQIEGKPNSAILVNEYDEQMMSAWSIGILVMAFVALVLSIVAMVLAARIKNGKNGKNGTNGVNGAPGVPSYEEGTWNPTLEFGGASTGITYLAQQGLYTRVGNVCYFTIRLVLTSKGSATGPATIADLPFPCDTTMPVNFNIGLTSGLTLAQESTIVGHIPSSGSTIELLVVPTDSAIAHTTLLDSECSNATTLETTGFYTIDD